MTSCEELAQLVNAFAASVSNLDARMDAFQTDFTNTNLEVTKLTKAIAFLEKPEASGGITKAQLDSKLNPLKDKLNGLGKLLEGKLGGVGLSEAAIVGMIAREINPLKMGMSEQKATLGDVRKMAKRLDALLGNQTETVKVLDKKWRESDARLGGSERMQDRLQKTIAKQRYELNQVDKAAKKAVEQSKKGAEALKVANKNKGLIDKVSQVANKSRGLINKVSKVADAAKKVGEGAAKGVKGLSFVKPLAPWIGALVNLAGFALTAVTFFATLELTGRQLNDFDEAIAKNDAIAIKQGSLIQQLKGRLETTNKAIDKIRAENLVFDRDFKQLKQTINRTDKEVSKQNDTLNKFRELIGKLANRLEQASRLLDSVYDYAIRIDQRYAKEIGNVTQMVNGTEGRLKITNQLAKDALAISTNLKAFRQDVSIQLGRLTGGMQELRTSLTQQVQSIPQLRNRLGTLEGTFTGLKGQLSGLEAKGNLTAQLAQQALTKPGTPGRQGQPGPPGTPGREGAPGKNGLNGKNGLDADQARLRQVETELVTIAGATAAAAAAIGGVNALKNRLGTVEKLSTNVQNQQEQLKREVEKELKQMPCKYSPALDTEIAANQNRTNGLVIRSMAVMDTINTVGIARLQATSNTINNKLGNQLTGGIGGFLKTKFDQVFKSTVVSRAIELLTLAASLHNAAMLSTNLASTLIDTTENILKAIKLVDPAGQEYSLSELLGKQLEGVIKSIVGEDNYNGMKTTWRKYNRILAASANLLNSIQSMTHSAISGIEIVGSWVAKGFNGIRKEGVVSDFSWPWFNPNPNFKNPLLATMEKLDNLDDAASSINSLAVEVLDIQETAKEIKEQKAELDKALADATNQLTAEDTKKINDSIAGSITAVDLIEFEG